MESYNQWIIEMLTDDSPRPPSWVTTGPATDGQESAAAVPSPPVSSASSTHWATTTFAIDDPDVMLNSLSDSSDDEEEAESEEERGRESTSPEEDASDAALDEEHVTEGDDSDPHDSDPPESDASECDEPVQPGASDEVRALKAACDFYMRRCDQMRDAVRNLSTELVETRAVLERRRELELMRGPTARVAKMAAGEFARELTRVLRGESSDQVEQPVGVDGNSNGGESLSVLQSFVQGLQRPDAGDDDDNPSAHPESANSGVQDATDSTELTSRPTVAGAAVSSESVARVVGRESMDEGGLASASDQSDEPPEEQDVVVPIRLEGTSYRQLTELPVERDDGNWHRHILQLLKAERKLRRQQLRQSDPQSTDSNADTASFHSTDDDGDDAGSRRRLFVLRSSSSSASETSNVSFAA